MNEIEIFNEISARIATGVIFHGQMADCFDFCNLRGLKRWQENRFFDEICEYRGVHRYVINHCNKLINDAEPAIKRSIPNSWYNATRLDVDSSTRRQAVKDAFERWFVWEKESKEFYQKKFKELTELGAVASANKVNEIIEGVDQELKQLTRKMLEYKAVDYNMEYIMQEQTEMHEKFRKELEEGFHVKIS